MLRAALRRRPTPLLAPAVRAAQVRFVGEQTGLSAMVSKSSVLRKHDTLGLGSEILVDTYSKKGFTISGVSLIGPVLLLPKAGFYFGPSEMSELTPESLALLQLLDTRIDTLVIGCGRQTKRLPPQVRSWSVERDIAIEVLPTQHACATFNFMVSENRSVAAVLWPLGEN